jgi:hypothetical protein
METGDRRLEWRLEYGGVAGKPGVGNCNTTYRERKLGSRNIAEFLQLGRVETPHQLLGRRTLAWL